MAGMRNHRMNGIRGAFVALMSAAALAGVASADQPKTIEAGTEVILTIGGKLAGSRPLQLDRGAIERLPMTRIRTTTPWHSGVQEFEGVSLAHLVDHAGAAGGKAIFTALNNYVTEIPLSDLKAHGPILAIRRNGEPMSVRDKGPLFVIYPFSDKPELRTELYYGRSVWQVRAIAID
jgi:hypothetical protein